MADNIRKIGRNWYVDVFYQGKRIRKVVGTDRKLALKIANKVLTQLIEGVFFDNKKEYTITLKEYAEQFLNDYSKIHKKPKSYRRDTVSVKALVNRLGQYPLNQITLEKIELYVKERLKDFSPTRPGQTITGATINREIYCLSNMYKRALKLKLVKENPVKGYERQKEYKRNECLTVEEFHKLIKVAEEHIRKFIIIAVTTGLRSSNILNLKWKQIDLQEETIFISGEETKNSEDLVLPILPILKDELMKIPSEKRNGFVICKQNGQKYSQIQKAYELALRKAEITRKIWKHDLRHTFASHATMSGIDVFTLKELMGHKSLEVTNRYTHLSLEHKRELIDKLNSRLDNNTEHFSSSIEVKELIEIFGKDSDIVNKVNEYLKNKSSTHKYNVIVS